jgi:hypothetical protein
MTRRTLRDKVALEFPVALVTEAGRAAGRAEALPVERDVAPARGEPVAGTRRGAGRALDDPRVFLIIDCFQEICVSGRLCCNGFTVMFVVNLQFADCSGRPLLNDLHIYCKTKAEHKKLCY